MGLAAFHPFIYWCHCDDEADGGSLDSRGQQCCYTAWAQLEGTGTLTGHGRPIILRPGQAALMPPGVVVSWPVGARFLRLAFDLVDRPRKPTGAGGWQPLRWTRQPAFTEIFGCDIGGRLAPEDAPALLGLLDRIATFWWRSEGELARCNLDLGRWLLDYAEAQGAAGFDPWAVSKDADLADQADIIIEHHFAARRSIADVARQLGVSREHLSRHYKAKRGYTLQDYLMRCRLRAAAGMLHTAKHHQQSLEDIARRCGFGSTRSLHRAFVQLYSESPEAYRKRRLRPVASPSTEHRRPPGYQPD